MLALVPVVMVWLAPVARPRSAVVRMAEEATVDFGLGPGQKFGPTAPAHASAYHAAGVAGPCGACVA